MAEQESSAYDLICNAHDKLQKIEEKMAATATLCSEMEEKMVENMEKMHRKNMKNLNSIEKSQNATENEVKSFKECLENIKKLLEQERSIHNSPNPIPPWFPFGCGATDAVSGSNPETVAGSFPELIEPLVDFVTVPKTMKDTETPEAVSAIQQTYSPLSPEELKRFLDQVKQKKNPYDLAQSFSSNINSLILQLVNLEKQLKKSPCPSGDRRLEMRLPKLYANLINSLHNPPLTPQQTLLWDFFSSARMQPGAPSSVPGTSTSTPSKRPAETTSTGTPSKVPHSSANP